MALRKQEKFFTIAAVWAYDRNLDHQAYDLGWIYWDDEIDLLRISEHGPAMRGKH